MGPRRSPGQPWTRLLRESQTPLLAPPPGKNRTRPEGRPSPRLTSRTRPTMNPPCGPQGSGVEDLDANALEGFALRLGLHDPDAAHLGSVGHVGAAVSLLVE